MAQCKVCDECKEVYREEGQWCKNEEVVFEFKRFHMGDGMNFPTGEIERSFCSLKCFKKWFDEKMKDDFKEISRV